ncbi:MAG: DUF4190 domain-containing protein [Kiritimatiellae bacterium]|nr:DUF4190 domain-containing protein [Kiritimatiellia bacterium]
MSIEFDCTNCGQTLSVDTSEAGEQAKCPSCDVTVTIPSSQQTLSTSQEANDTIYCTKCGQQNRENDYKCTSCGFPLHDLDQPKYVVADDNTLGGLIPYKNAKALWAYYCGVFSLIPCVGIPLGIVALILGIKGLKYANVHEESKGKAHAWVGIILGGFCAISYTLLIAITVTMSILKN